MKVSLNWARELSGVTLKTPELVEVIGTRLGAVEEVVDFGARYADILIVKVVECTKHPGADKLHVCKIDDRGVAKNVKRDSKGLVQVVCGAPNVRAGMLAVWIPPGSTVPSTYDKDPFKLEARGLRGVVSNGMLASPQELGLGDSHAGLLELDSNAKSGASFAKTYDLDDTIIDIENKMFTHRPDCFGQLGVAREIAGITHKQFTSPGWYRQDAKISGRRAGLKLEVKNDIPKLVPRFCAVVIENIEVGPSPIWLQATLVKLGVKPINNIVDITNYMMLLSAQPLHAYDYDKLATGRLGARLSRDNEELALLNGKNIKLKKGAIVITDGAKPVGLGGVMGGAETEVSAETKNIVIESATFDMNLTRRTAFEYGLFTEGVTRFTKGQSPLQNMAVMARAAELVEQLAGGKTGQVHDLKLGAPGSQKVVVAPDFIDSRLGLKLSEAEIKRVLGNVEFGVAEKSGKLNVSVPFWRTDIEIPEDVVEEVGRLWGYEHLPQILPHRSIVPPPLDPLMSLKSRLRSSLAKAGANEVLAYSFVSADLLEKCGQDPSLAYKIANAISPGLQYYRLSLTPSLLEKVNSNVRAGYGEFALFEIGKAHGKSEVDEHGLPVELNRLALVTAAKNSKGAPFFWAKRYAEALAAGFGYELEYKPLPSVDLHGHKMAAQMIAPFASGRSAWVFIEGKLAGVVGEYKAEVVHALKLPTASAGFELFLSPFDSNAKPAYRPLNRFPATDQDLCLRAAATHTYQQLTDFLRASLAETAAEHGYQFDLQPLDIYQPPKQPEYRQTTWRITVWHPERTLTTEEINRLLDGLAQAAKKNLKAERI